ncbi:hypothetical protein GMORB2_6452 [Geosmithia morbida]|uniref:Carboxylesterase family protein n=1 Tax=Geosmithia morbida TaxID=1094350 RepID=A0A9P5D4P2_9HYPO|nr:uncharacterized protein GMORB2_6452 [Geosmithia morbida]KAF4123751.1 hypothetical protein GMORB2_6452 [Geosmithia morbida]
MAASQYLAPGITGDKNVEVVEVVEQAVSPSLSQYSDQGGGVHGQLGGLPTPPRIEDSLAELDKLEDDLEAVGFVTRSGRTERRKTVDDTPLASDGSRSGRKGPKPAQAMTTATWSATTSTRTTAKPGPAPGRTSQGPMRGAGAAGAHNPADRTPADPSIARTRSVRDTPESRATVKSTKPLTVPKFELPGEAIARRLKEQREARQAQQAEAQRAQAAPPTRTRSTKPLTRPTFELPGEAISRRKREEREAKLKAQEEEERKRREFKARPIRNSLTPGSLPRETVTSRARTSKFSSEESPKDQEPRRDTKWLSPANATGRLPATGSGTNSRPQLRGRNSMATLGEIASRTPSASTGISDKRSSVSAEDAAQMRARGKEIYARDNSITMDRERERREREALARTAREEAAERSRAASREWAEKKRQRDKALAESLRARESLQTR